MIDWCRAQVTLIDSFSLLIQTIMKDKWMNNNYENDELKPYVEPKADFSDQRRIEILTQMGYSRDEIEESLRLRKYDDAMAIYLLLGKRTTEVCLRPHSLTNGTGA